MASALSTDLYEIAMMAGYHAEGLTALASFELFVRRLPPRRAFLVAAGLEQALDYLENLSFTGEDIAYLRTVPSLNKVPGTFFDDYLPRFRFTGDVWAVPEGTPMFAGEPFLRVTASLPEAQFVETALLALIGFPTSIASKAARVVHAAGRRPVMEFGSRRAHGVEAGMLAARAAYIAGCAGTSNVEAGARFGIPVSGTMAHSWVMAHANEREAFRTFSSTYPAPTLLIDTYDTVRAAEQVVASGLHPTAVRLDSGDARTLSRRVRRILDRGGLKQTGIFVSGDLDEDRVSALLKGGTPIDGFGVGTALSTSMDAPALSAVYKIVEIERDDRLVPTMKISAGKQSWPGRKQVWRRLVGGRAAGDVIAREDGPGPARAVPLLREMMRAGRRVGPSPSVDAVRAHCRDALVELPADLHRLRHWRRYPVTISRGLRALAREVRSRL